MKEVASPEVVFMDTNALHFIHLYLEYARAKDLYPFSPKEGENTVDEANECLDKIEETNFKKSLKKGLSAVKFLSTMKDVRVEYSPVSELELMAGRAKGRAIENAAKEGIPDRMWTRIFDEEIAKRLKTADLINIKERVEKLDVILEEVGIIVEVSNAGRIRDIFDLARSIAGLVYLGFADSVIYASALVAGADYFITEDRYLGKIVNRIRNGQQGYDEIRYRLKTVIAQITLVKSTDVALPEALRISNLKGKM